jgi:hypothetical protein
VKITIEEKVLRAKEIDVDFPLYIELIDVLDSGDAYEYQHRILADGTTDTIVKRETRGEGVSFETRSGRMPLTRLGEYFQSDYHRSEKGKFDRLLKEAASAFAAMSVRGE